jgi:hypothetical protein
MLLRIFWWFSPPSARWQCGNRSEDVATQVVQHEPDATARLLISIYLMPVLYALVARSGDRLEV